MQRFFDSYPRFYDTTGTRRLPNRFQQRWRMIVEANASLFAGARVLDLASHDGRWSFAVLKAGAAYVRGVEARPEFVASAGENFRHYGIEAGRYDFVGGDLVDYMDANRNERFDIVLNLGFFYHTLKHLQIVEQMARTGAAHIILDTGLSPSTESVIQVSLDAVSDHRNAVDHLDQQRAAVPVGRVSRSALGMMFGYAGYGCAELDWHSRIDDFSECEDYRTGNRGTFLASRAA